MEITAEATTAVKTPEQRKELLARAIASEIRQGARIESQSDFQAVTVRGSKPNHILHLILTLITLGFWGIIWIAVAALGGEKRGVIDVDEYGNTNIQR